jgi:hypothetical protein
MSVAVLQESIFLQDNASTVGQAALLAIMEAVVLHVFLEIL